MIEMFDNRPGFAITINGMPSLLVNQNLNSLTLVENRGFDADTLQLIINDPDGTIALPNRKAEITLAIGFGMTLINKGKFIVDSVTHAGPPDVISIGAHSADFKREFLERKSDLYENKTLEEIVTKIAGKYGWEPKIADIFKNIKIEAKQQADESDANLLTRLAQEYDAVATIKMGKLLFLERGVGKTANGESLELITHRRSDGDQHSYSVSDREQYSGVEARYIIQGQAKRKSIIVGEEERVYKMRKIYNSEAEAQTAAERQLERLKRNRASVAVNLARGNARLSSESPLKLVGFKSEVDSEQWIVSTITHKMDSSTGFVSQLQAEVVPEEKEK